MAGPSNIRRRGQGQEEKDKYLDEPFMRRDRNKVFADPMDDDDEEPPQRGGRRSMPDDDLTGDPMWDNYRIKPSMSMEDKIEILVVNYNKMPIEIELILNMSYAEAEKRVADLEMRLRNLGKPLDSEDKDLERGKAIRALQRLLLDIDRELAVTHDPRLLSSKMTAQRELNQLMSLAIDRKADKNGGDTEDVFAAAMNKMDADKTRQLHERLKARRPQSSS